jgi:nitroreductase
MMDLEEAMRTQGTCRYYQDREVPDEVLYRAFDAARFGPQGGNRQPVRFVVVRDPTKKRQLKEWYLGPWKAYLSGIGTGEVRAGALPKTVEAADHFAEHFDEVPALVVVCAEVDGLHPTDHELGRLSVVGGGSIYPIVQNFLLACRNEGLGSALTTLLCVFEPQVKELLDIPDGVITAATIAVGWPAKPFPSKLTRIDVDDMVHVDSYGGRTLSR